VNEFTRRGERFRKRLKVEEGIVKEIGSVVFILSAFPSLPPSITDGKEGPVK